MNGERLLNVYELDHGYKKPLDTSSSLHQSVKHVAVVTTCSGPPNLLQDMFEKLISIERLEVCFKDTVGISWSRIMAEI